MRKNLQITKFSSPTNSVLLLLRQKPPKKVLYHFRRNINLAMQNKSKLITAFSLCIVYYGSERVSGDERESGHTRRINAHTYPVLGCTLSHKFQIYYAFYENLHALAAAAFLAAPK